MADHTEANVWELADLATPWCIRTVAALNIAGHMEAGLSGIEELAAAAEADAGSLDRVLRHLAGKGVFERVAPGRYALNGAARTLRETQRWFAGGGIGARMDGAWSSLPNAVRTGSPGYAGIFGRSFWDDLDADPALAADFDALMGVAGHGVPDPEVLPASGWDGVVTVVDVGGGTGALLAEILRAHPDVRGTLVDMPRVTAGAGPVLADVAGRATIVAQSFFDPLPAGADVYVMKSVLFDWPDAEAARILARCAEAMGPGSRLSIVGGVSPDGEEPDPDLLMLVLLGGKGRSLGEFRALAAPAGLAVSGTGRQSAGRFVVECRRA